ncbi:hypothetical protein CK203_066322 [Vitis vinifera]|uniref:Uncharacterized protein n=1 Tax=Vitis vinifera TaxID=29760 RepID=A0A438G582_VITVI|nr:hypothetical protein CK203_066322 [Vitis vinifera]
MLHIAVELGEARMGFVEKLVEFMPSEALALRDSDGATALFNACKGWQHKSSQVVSERKPKLAQYLQPPRFCASSHAVKYGHKELTLYLLSVTRDNEPPYPFSNSPGFELLRRALMVGFHDVSTVSGSNVILTLPHAISIPPATMLMILMRILPFDKFYDADKIYYSELYKAVVNGDWESASELLEQARIDILALKDSDGATALFNAVRADNIEAVKLLVTKSPSLLNTCNHSNLVPLHSALRYGHKELTLYLLPVTSDDVDPSPFEDKPGIELLLRALMVGFHDVALYLVKRYPDLATCNSVMLKILMMMKILMLKPL